MGDISITNFASIAQTDTGTSTDTAVTPDGLAGSDFGMKKSGCVVVDFTTDVSTGDGKFYFPISSDLDGFDLVYVQGAVVTVGTGSTMTVQIYNVTQATDMLTSLLTINASTSVSTTATIDTANDDVTANDILRIDIDTVHTTPAKGFIIILGFRKP